MRDVIGLAYTDISGRLFMREGAIRIAVMRARQRLEQALAEVEEGTQQS
jgi:DNA-directed RNA polymerase specialized sigma24 family protein